MNRILAILNFFQWNNCKDFLAKHTLIGFSASAGTSVVFIFAVINPILQFIGLTIGIYIGYLTAEAKIEAKRERRALKHANEEALRRDFYLKEQKALAHKAEKTQNGK